MAADCCADVCGTWNHERATGGRGGGKDRNERFLPPPQPPAEPADRDSWNAFYWREQATFDWWSSRVTLPDHVSVCVRASALLLSPHCTTVLFDNWTTDASRGTMIYPYALLVCSTDKIARLSPVTRNLIESLYIIKLTFKWPISHIFGWVLP